MTNEQLELGFGGVKIQMARGKNRIARGQWWFTQIRQIVNNAMDWSATAGPQPEQIWIPGAHREVKT
jgi:hypothetical protein